MLKKEEKEERETPKLQRKKRELKVRMLRARAPERPHIPLGTTARRWSQRHPWPLSDCAEQAAPSCNGDIG